MIDAAKSFFNRFGVRQKIIVILILLIVLPGSILCYYYFSVSNVMHKEILQLAQQALKQTEINISNKLKDVEKTSNIILKNQRIYELLSKKSENNTYTQFEEERELRGIFASVTDMSSLFNIQFFINRNKIYSNERVNFFPISDIESKPWYQNVINQNGRNCWISTYTVSDLDMPETRILSCARLLRNINNYSDTIGVLMLDIEEKALSDILAEIEITGQKNVYIINATGSIISHIDKTMIGKKAPIDISKLFGRTLEGVYKDDDTFYGIYREISDTGWFLVAEVNYNSIGGQRILFYNITIISIILLIIYILIIILISGVLIDSQVKRIKEMIFIMEKEGIHKASELPAIDGEVLKLRKGLDKLIEKMHKLIEEGYEAKIKEREALMMALQAQINPHFLYNTLETVNRMALQNGSIQISKVIMMLAKYFRLSLNRGRDIVSIEDEVNLATIYLNLQKFRFTDRYDIVTEIDEKVFKYAIPKLTLQPIVENALLHGIQKCKDKKCTIRIRASLNDNCMVISITDDGIGMDQDMCKRIVEPNSSSGYGLYNVMERVKIFSEDTDECGVTVQSMKGAGTTVKITLLAIELKDMDNKKLNMSLKK